MYANMDIKYNTYYDQVTVTDLIAANLIGGHLCKFDDHKTNPIFCRKLYIKSTILCKKYIKSYANLLIYFDDFVPTEHRNATLVHIFSDEMMTVIKFKINLNMWWQK